MSDLKVGDKVVLVEPDGWLQPFRKWAQAGRHATVKEVRPVGDRVVITFVGSRPVKWPRDYEAIVRPQDIRKIEDPMVAE